ncbi:MAG TPA: hypothetical protein VEQ42_03010 [Pyrinomonadaceae bacterium]|nr:hypothetical protein [Pyrinomonadaceae bacterium]
MSPRLRPGRRLLKAVAPIAVLLALTTTGLVGWLVYDATRPPRRPYLVTPEKFELLSHRGLRATEETWQNRDGTAARGWLLRGDASAPAVVVLHRYGADRSWFLNFGVKLNEATNFTVLWPDLRGHGEQPPVEWSSFGSREWEDALAAVEYLRTLKTPQGRPLIGERVGLYGVELGAYAALTAAAREPRAQSLVLDSVPSSPDDVLTSAVRSNTGFDNFVVRFLARAGTRVYFLGGYANTESCAAARALGQRHVLLLAGQDAPHLRDSTAALARCLGPDTVAETVTDLPLTGVTLGTATGEQGELYDRRAIDFFDRTLRDDKRRTRDDEP